MDMSSGSGSFLSSFSAHGLSVGSCLSLGGCLSSSSGLTEVRVALVSLRPALLSIEPPLAAGLKLQSKQAIAKTNNNKCFDSALPQAQHGRFFVLVHFVVCSFWSEPCAQELEKYSQVFWVGTSFGLF